MLRNGRPQFIPKGGSIPNYEIIIERFEEAMNVTHPIFDAGEMHFNKTDQTLELYGTPALLERLKLVNDALVRIREVLQGRFR